MIARKTLLLMVMDVKMAGKWKIVEKIAESWLGQYRNPPGERGLEQPMVIETDRKVRQLVNELTAKTT